MKVSIIIPVYNVSLYIKDCLNSVLAQDYNDIEIIIVNDCTKDDSMEVIDTILQINNNNDKVAIINHKQNKGLSAARNTGINHASGKYVYFLDSDDEITSDCISSLVKVAKQYSSPDIVVGDYRVEGSDAFFPPLRLKSGLLEGEALRKAYMKERIYVMAWNKLVRRDYLLENKLFFKEGLIHEDCLWSFQCALTAGTMGIVKHPCYIYKVRENSIKTNTNQDRDIAALTTVLCEMVDYSKLKNYSDNKYVHSFIEEEKLRLLYAHLNYGRNFEAFDEIFGLYRSLPHLSLGKIFRWDILKTRKIMRDAHYFLPQSLAKEYYWNIPGILGRRKKIRNKIRFYFWFLSLCISRMFGEQHFSLPFQR